MTILKNKIGLGTSLYGYHAEDRSAHQDIFNQAIDLGYRLFDTAEDYASGRSELIVGNGIAHSSIPRSEFEVITKIHPANISSADQIYKSCQLSLERLQTEYIDLYMLHGLLPYHRDASILTGVINELNSLVDKGLIKHLGICNVLPEELKMWRSLEIELAVPHRIKVVQHRYNLVLRSDDMFLAPLLEALDLISMPHTPFCGGYFRGFNRPPHIGIEGDFWSNPRTLALEPIANSIGATLPQFIIAFLHRANNAKAIPRSFNLTHLAENLDSMQFVSKITQTIYDQVESLFPITHPYPNCANYSKDYNNAVNWNRSRLPL